MVTNHLQIWLYKTCLLLLHLFQVRVVRVFVLCVVCLCGFAFLPFRSFIHVVVSLFVWLYFVFALWLFVWVSFCVSVVRVFCVSVVCGACL